MQKLFFKHYLYIFKKVFGIDRSRKIFDNQFLNTPLGYSLHTIMIVNNEIVGAHTDVPAFFIVDGKKMLFSTGADTMILKGYRDIFNYMDMMQCSEDYRKQNGYVVGYGYPNDLNHTILNKAKMVKDIGRLYTYCIPYRIGGIKKGLRFFNFASILFSWCFVQLSSIFASKKKVQFRIEKDLESYNKYRYQRNDAQYVVENNFTYKIMEYEGIRAVFLIDVFEKSPYNFCKAVKFILKNEKKKFDILLYPGNLPFKITGMVKIPHKYEPKHFFMTAKVINKKECGNINIFDINNWDTNLSNYDLI